MSSDWKLLLNLQELLEVAFNHVHGGFWQGLFLLLYLSDNSKIFFPEALGFLYPQPAILLIH
jgi:hypothetical protein